jgi:hypothetical protein
MMGVVTATGVRPMGVRNLRIGLAAFFLLMAVVLFLRHQLIPPEWVANIPEWKLAFGAWFALVLAGWNTARWYLDWSAIRARAAAGSNPLAVRTIKPEEQEPDPAFDFTDPGRTPPRPSTNGDQR